MNYTSVTFLVWSDYICYMRLITGIFILSTFIVKSQPDFSDAVNDEANPCGGEVNLLEVNKKPMQGQYVREADVAWEKRVWREIDMREKLNLPLYFPTEYQTCRISLFQLVCKHVLKQQLVAFEDENYYKPLSLDKIRSKLIERKEIEEITYDEKGFESTKAITSFDSVSLFARVTKVRIVEDWFLNKQSSTMEVRIVSMGFFEFVEEKEAYKELFWVYFPMLEKYLAKYRVFNPKNIGDYSTFNDLFKRRQFSSLIIKESNVYDRNIAEYCAGIDALLESDRIKYEIFKMEHDWWQY